MKLNPLYGQCRPDLDFPALLALYARGELLLDELVTRTYRLEEAEQAFETCWPVATPRASWCSTIREHREGARDGARLPGGGPARPGGVRHELRDAHLRALTNDRDERWRTRRAPVQPAGAGPGRGRRPLRRPDAAARAASREKVAALLCFAQDEEVTAEYDDFRAAIAVATAAPPSTDGEELVTRLGEALSKEGSGSLDLRSVLWPRQGGPPWIVHTRVEHPEPTLGDER